MNIKSKIGVLLPLTILAISGCTTNTYSASSTNSNSDIRRIDNVTWKKQSDITIDKVVSQEVGINETLLVFIRGQDNLSNQASANISVNDKFQVSLHENGFTSVKSCVGNNRLSANVTGNKDNNLLSGFQNFDLKGGETYYFLVKVTPDGNSSITQINNNDEAIEFLNNKRYQSHQISRVTPNCLEPIVPKPTPKAPVLEEKVTIDLEVLFENDKSIVRPNYYQKIEEVAEFMNKYSDTTATIEGHTDSNGSDEYNLSLSQNRADAVKRVLINTYGIDYNRVRAIGYGESRPRADNNTDQGRQLNRRVVAVIQQN